MLPYVVKIAPPEGRLISVPRTRTRTAAPKRASARAGRARCRSAPVCMPPEPRAAKRRFAVGDRVACAVEDESDDFTVWAAGTVVAVDYSVAADAEALVPQREWMGAAAVVPYRVALDISRVAVLVHKDEHGSCATSPPGGGAASGGRRLALPGAPREAAARRRRRARSITRRATCARVRAARLRRRGVAHNFRPR